MSYCLSAMHSTSHGDVNYICTRRAAFSHHWSKCSTIAVVICYCKSALEIYIRTYCYVMFFPTGAAAQLRGIFCYIFRHVVTHFQRRLPRDSLMWMRLHWHAIILLIKCIKMPDLPECQWTLSPWERRQLKWHRGLVVQNVECVHVCVC